MNEKKKSFARQSPTPTVEDLEKTAEQLNTVAKGKGKATNDNLYSYSLKLDEDLERRVEEATKKHRQTKKGFFLSAIEERLEKLGY